LSHAKHQRLMRELSHLQPKIRAWELTMKQRKGKVGSEEWELLVQGLKRLTERRATINREIKKL